MTSRIHIQNCIRAKLRALAASEVQIIEIMALVDDVYQVGRDDLEAEMSVRLEGAKEDGFSDGYSEGRYEAECETMEELENAKGDRDALLRALGFVEGDLGRRREEALLKISQLMGESQ